MIYCQTVIFAPYEVKKILYFSKLIADKKFTIGRHSLMKLANLVKTVIFSNNKINLKKRFYPSITFSNISQEICKNKLKTYEFTDHKLLNNFGIELKYPCFKNYILISISFLVVLQIYELHWKFGTPLETIRELKKFLLKLKDKFKKFLENDYKKVFSNILKRNRILKEIVIYLVYLSYLLLSFLKWLQYLLEYLLVTNWRFVIFLLFEKLKEKLRKISKNKKYQRFVFLVLMVSFIFIFKKQMRLTFLTVLKGIPEEEIKKVLLKKDEKIKFLEKTINYFSNYCTRLLTERKILLRKLSEQKIEKEIYKAISEAQLHQLELAISKIRNYLRKYVRSSSVKNALIKIIEYMLKIKKIFRNNPASKELMPVFPKK